MINIQQRLFSLRDESYRIFQCRLMPTVDSDTVLGVRMPALRALARELSGTPAADDFLAALPHRYYEENNLHGILLCRIKEYAAAVAAADAFLPYVDNWATCDLLSPKVFAGHTAALWPEICRWLTSAHTYTVRFGIDMLMRFYLETNFRPDCLEAVVALRSEEYYIHMAAAWFFATALAKQYDAALPYMENHRLDTWTHNKTIQKAVESYRITDRQKAYLKTLKIK